MAKQAGECLVGRLEGVYAIHGRATAGLLQAAAEQTMQSIAALGKQWAEVRTGEIGSRWKRPTAGTGEQNRRPSGQALGQLGGRSVRATMAVPLGSSTL